MPRSDWLPFCALAGGLILASVVNAQPIQKDTLHRPDAQQRHDQPEAKPTPQIPVAVQTDIDRIARALESANTHPNATAEQQYTRDYLQTQKDVVKWARRMFGVALFESLITAVGIALVYFTLKAARTSAAEAKRAADAARDAVEQAKQTTAAAIRQAAVAESQLKDLERPYLFVENVRIGNPIPLDWRGASDDFIVATRIDAFYDLANYGRSPATIKELKGGVYIGPDLPASPNPLARDTWTDEIVVGAQEKRDKFFFFYRGKMDGELIGQLFHGRNYVPEEKLTKCFFFVEIRYESLQGLTEEFGVIYEFLIDINRFVVRNIPNYTYRRMGTQSSN
jgi:hypothetical protein